MKVMLFFPPFWQPMMPHLALPSLTAALRARGHQVVQRDLNVETFDHILSRDYLDGVLRHLPQDRKRLSKVYAGQARLKAVMSALDWGLQKGPWLATHVESTKRTVRGAGFYDGERGLAALDTLVDALHLGCLAYFPSELTLTGYQSPYPMDASAAILAAVSDRQTNVFYSIFEQTVLPDIRRERPDVVGISLTCQHQAIAAFTLAHLIKQAGIKAHLVIGGKMITCWNDILPERPALFSLFDSAVYHEGEPALLALLDVLASQGDLATVPNLIWRKGGTIVRNEEACWQDVATLPSPDFDGFPLDLYLAPERVLPVSASRGCYWRRCAFCNVGYGESHAFRERPARQVAGDMAALSQRYGVHHFFFADEAVSPRMFKQLPSLLQEAGLDVNWACCARFDRGITAHLLQEMHTGGCRMLLFGLESGSQRVLDLINKGTTLSVAQRIMQDAAAAGIWNHLFLFFGFPTESTDEAAQTLDFLKENRLYIHSLCTGTFLLEKYADVADDPDRFSVTPISPAPQHDLPFYYDYLVSTGMSAADATMFEDNVVSALPDKRYAQFYFHDTYRFLYASHLAGHGPLPLMLPDEP